MPAVKFFACLDLDQNPSFSEQALSGIKTIGERGGFDRSEIILYARTTLLPEDTEDRQLLL